MVDGTVGGAVIALLRKGPVDLDGIKGAFPDNYDVVRDVLTHLEKQGWVQRTKDGKYTSSVPAGHQHYARK